MTSRFNSDENFNELIFENRNKDYGAYEIRSTYNDRVAKSLAITIMAISLLVCIMVYASKSPLSLSPSIDSPPVITEWHEMKLPPPEKLDVPAAKAKDPLLPKTDNLNFKATNDPVETDVRPVEQANPGLAQNNKGNDTAAGVEFKEPAEPPVPVENTEVHPIADVMPEFEGDVYKFVYDHIHYPQIAVENGTQGTVYVSFVIEKDGAVGDIKILSNKVGDGCTEEAIRVVKMMPKWKPGKIKGNAVRVIINLPVRFHLKS